MIKYAELYALILEKINGETPTPFYLLDSGKVADECEKLSTRLGERFRVLDRRLQALRKAGKIKSVPGKGWIKLNEVDK